MLGGIAIEKEINPRETAQICVGLHVEEIKSLRESSNAYHYIFYSVKYSFSCPLLCFIANNQIFNINSKHF